MKYYTNLIKIVGKTKCFILGTNSKVERDRVVSECSKYIFNIQKNIKKRMSLLKEDAKVQTHTDMEIVLSEKQGEKLVYVLEATKSIASNDNNTLSRKNGKLLFRLFKRYSKVVDFHSKICKTFSSKYLPPIPSKVLNNEKTEVTERRQVNFELFFQTIMIHESYLNHEISKEFFKLEKVVRNKNQKLKVYYLDREPSFYTIELSYETTTQEILNEIAEQWDIRDIKMFRICFVSEKYGEKTLDLHECPCQVIENFEATKTNILKNFIGKSVSSKPRSNILRYFEKKNKYVFYIRRVIFDPEDYTLDFRMTLDELKRRYYQ